MHIYTHTRTNTHINILTGTNTQACLLKYAYARAQCTSKHAEINTNTKHNAYLQKQQQFKRVNRSMRCGRCHTCLNPKLKKACLTLRASQEKASGDGEDGLEHKVPCCGFRIDCAPCCASLSLSLSVSLTLSVITYTVEYLHVLKCGTCIEANAYTYTMHLHTCYPHNPTHAGTPPAADLVEASCS